MIIVYISLKDVNDNIFIFVKNFYFKFVDEIVIIGGEIIIFEVNDFDLGFNSDFIYFIVSGNDWGFFSIEFK